MSANNTLVVAEFHPEYEYFMADLWVGVVLTLLVLSCVCCVGSCLLYHKLQQWKQRVVASGAAVDMESLPSYTIVSGLPTYEEALQQLRCAREPPRPQPLSVLELLQLYEYKAQHAARSRSTKV
ncbi:protein commissureless 2 homolog [Anabrus simplex]|uniref:protein commissureless 2 homolog n=1 Tax=Anabrus simplex TaxID=316456 RepID=UPI0034DCCAB2